MIPSRLFLILSFGFVVATSLASGKALADPSQTKRFTPVTSMAEETTRTVESLRSLVDRLARLNTPNTFFVSLGAAPLAVVADLESRFGSEKILHLPISSLGQILEPDFPKDEAKLFLESYLDHFLARALAKEQPRLIVIDYSLTGRSLQAAQIILRDYFTPKSPDIKLSLVGLTYSRFMPSRRQWDFILPLDNEMDDLFLRRHFEYLRPWRRFTLRQWVDVIRKDKPANQAALQDLIEAQLSQLYLAKGEREYRAAVDFFRAHPRSSKSMIKRLADLCSILFDPTGA